MSIEVPLSELDAALAPYPWGYLLTVTDDGQARVMAVPSALTLGRWRIVAGERTRSNAAARPAVAMVFPPASGAGHSLVVDAVATTDGDVLVVEPTHAVLHRPALPA